MKSLRCFSFTVLLLVSFYRAFAQIPPIPAREDRLDVTQFGAPISVYADGYGIHAVYFNSVGQVTHRLFKNDGTEMAGFSNNLFVSNVTSPVVTGYNGVVYVAMLEQSLFPSKVLLRRSNDGGASWVALQDYDIGPANQITGAGIDATADQHGVHVVWSHATTASSQSHDVHYIRYAPLFTPPWIGYKNVTDLPSTTSGGGYSAKVRTYNDFAVVSYLNINNSGPSFTQLSSRDLLDIPTDAWDSSYFETNVAGIGGFRRLNMNVTSDGVFQAGLRGPYFALEGGARRLATKLIGGGWSVVAYGTFGEEIRLTSIPGASFGLSIQLAGEPILDQRAELKNISTSEILLLHQRLSDPTYFHIHSPRLTSSKSGVYSFWSSDTFYNNQFYVLRYLVRKPLGISGFIINNHFFTGKNWVTGNVSIEAGTTVLLKPGSITYLQDNQRIFVRSGATLTCEQGAQIVRGVNAEIMVDPGGTFNACGSETFSDGSCTLVRGTMNVGPNTNLTYNNGGFLVVDGGTLNVADGSALVIANSGASRLEVRQPSTFTFGSSSSITVNGTMDIWNNTTLSLPSNSQFFANAGAQFKMGTSAFILTESKLHAIGTAQSPVVFQGTNGTTWEGIRAKSGNFSGILGDIRVENATFSNATKPIHLETPVAAYITNVTMNSPQIGVEILPNYNLWVEPPPPPTMQLAAVTINGAYSFGITVENFSDLQLGSCVVSGNQGIAGIALTGSSPKMLESTFSGFDIGIWGVANSSPLLFDQGIGGFNIFTQNNVGAQFEGSSNAALGIDDGTGGQNSFTAYYSYAVALADNSIVNSEWNWYGTPSPTQNLFSITGGSKLYWEPYLTSPPGGNGATSSIAGKEEVEDPRFTPTDPRMKQVLQLRVQGRNTEASALLIAIIADGGATMQIKRWALGHLLAVSQKLRAPNLAAYLNTLQSIVPQLRQYLAELLPGAHVHERSVRNALDCYTSNIRNHSNSITEAQALYGKFTYALYAEGNRTEAQALLNTLQSRYTRSGQAKLATAQFAATRQSLSPGNGLVGKGVASNSTQVSETKSSAFALHQNYPNPFNPTTEVRYQISEANHVTLKVFDVLGREVATLVNEDRSPGAYDVTFDASSLASGIYMYKLQAGAQTEVKRMLLLK